MFDAFKQRDLSLIEEDESFWSTDISVSLRMVPQWITGWAWRSVGKRPKSPLPESTHILSTAWLGMGFTVAFDVEIPADENKSALYKLGGEYIAGRSVPLRMGWNYRETTGNEVGVGIGWIEKSGALDLGFSKHFYGEYALALVSRFTAFLLSRRQSRGQQLKQLRSLKKLRLHLCQCHLQHQLR